MAWIMLPLRGFSEDVNITPSPGIREVLQKIEDVMKREQIPGLMISIVKKDSILFSGGLGYADMEKGVKAHARSQFHLASVTKFFVALAIHRLNSEGRLHLGDPLKSLAPEIPFANPWEADDPVRLVHLLEHTTGFEDIRLNHMVGTGLTGRYFLFGQAVFYWILCFRQVRRHRLNRQRVSSFTAKIDLAWVNYLLIAVFALILIRMSGILHPKINDYAPVFYFPVIILLAWLALTQESVYPAEDHPGAKREEKPAYERLTRRQVEQLKDTVIRKTSTEKLYLDPALTLSVLSEKTGIGMHELSYVLNNGLDKISINSLMNSARQKQNRCCYLKIYKTRTCWRLQPPPVSIPKPLFTPPSGKP